jgi:hypothetical protein
MTQTIDDGRVLMLITRRRLEQVQTQLTEIAKSLDAIAMKCTKEKLDGDTEPRKWEWLRKSGKVARLLQEARVVRGTLESTLDLELFQNTGVIIRNQDLMLVAQTSTSSGE